MFISIYFYFYSGSDVFVLTSLRDILGTLYLHCEYPDQLWKVYLVNLSTAQEGSWMLATMQLQDVHTW